MKSIFPLLIAAVLGTAPLLAEEGIKSGLQVGDTFIPFTVQDVTGPRKGNSLCYGCAFGKHSVINIQAKTINAELVSVLKQLDSLVDDAGSIKGESKHAFLVYLTEEPDLAEKELAALAKAEGLKNIPLTIYDELSGPPPYKLADAADVTVMMWNDTKVTTNLAFSKAGMNAVAVNQILSSAKTHLAN